MRPRFQADANFNGDIIDGLIRKDPTIDFRTAHSLDLAGVPDEKVLLRCAEEDRILVSHDFKTMKHHFGRFMVTHECPGVILISQDVSIGSGVDALFLVWYASSHEEYRNRIVVLPY
jgi:hypothetical protein